jgi:hypothetical protein
MHEVRTATVELPALTINGRKMSLAVFRQVRNEELIAPDGTLNGAPWGWVNYHPDRCGDIDLRHWHVVWTRDGELLRARVYEQATFDWPTRYTGNTRTFNAPEVDRYVTWRVWEWVHGRQEEDPLWRMPNNVRGFRPYQKVTIDGMDVRGNASEAASIAADRRARLLDPPMYDSHGYCPKPETLAREADESAAVLDAEVASWGMSGEEVAAAYRAAVQAELARREAQRAIRAQLGALPQLFIAV